MRADILVVLSVTHWRAGGEQSVTHWRVRGELTSWCSALSDPLESEGRAGDGCPGAEGGGETGCRVRSVEK